MKTKIEFLTISIMIIGIFSIFTKVNAQVTGSGTVGKVPLWSGSTTNLGNSIIQESSSKIGIGKSPAFKLDVDGDINMPSTSALHIGNYPFLFNNNISNSVFIGVSVGYSGSDNTFVGAFAGYTNQGFSNTFVGSNAGNGGNSGLSYNNTAVGCSTLFNTEAYGGCAVGFLAALNNTTGCSITAMGEHALQNSETGDDNCGFGHNAGVTIVTGENNTFLGAHADASDVDLNNASAIGANAITSNSNEMILGDNSVYVGIGYSGVATFPPGKLSVDEFAGEVELPTIAGFFHNGDVNYDAPSSFEKRGIYAYSDGIFLNSSGGWYLTNIGGDFEAGNAEEANIAVRGRTGKLSEGENGLFGYGGWFEANLSTSDNIGVWTTSDGNGSGVNYGIYASAPIDYCGTGSCSDAAGYFNGDVYTTSSAYYSSSDINLKDNIQPLQNAMSVINALNPKSFTFRTNQFPYLNLPLGNQDGLLAQDVKNVLPQLVKGFKVPIRVDSLGNMDTTGTNTPILAVNYLGIIPYLIGAAKEQQHNIDSLKNLIERHNVNDSLISIRINQLEQMINNCCLGSGGPSHRVKNPIDVELGSENSIILNQNDPNPFAEQTRITYSVPADVKVAKIIFFDNSGHIIQTVNINERGNGQINVYGEKLSSGIYSYTLLADGKVIDTKKMICNK